MERWRATHGIGERYRLEWAREMRWVYIWNAFVPLLFVRSKPFAFYVFQHVSPKTSTFVWRIKKKSTNFAMCSSEHDIYLLNFPAELRPRKGYSEQYLIRVEVCVSSVDFHNELEAVAGLAGNMADLRFILVKMLVQTFNWKYLY